MTDGEDIEISIQSINSIFSSELYNFISNFTYSPLTLPYSLKSLYASSSEWSSAIIVAKIAGKIVGVAPFRYRKKHFFKFVFYHCIVDPSFEFEAILKISRYIIDNIQSFYSIFYLPNQKKDVNAVLDDYILMLKKNGLKYRLEVGGMHSSRRRILEVNCDWEKYVLSMNKKRRRKIRKIENKVNRELEYEVIIYDEVNVSEKMFDDIKSIENNSWKQKKNKGDDELLLCIIEGIRNKGKSDTYSWELFIFYVENVPISYSLNIEYKDSYYLIKTSYHNQYSQYSPGKFITNETIKHVFRKKNVRLIDFITDLDFMDAWTKKTIDNYQVKIWKNPILSNYWKLNEFFKSAILNRKHNTKVSKISSSY